jgi:hypothetical protein
MDKYFITDDTALAAYLYLCGMKFIEATIWGSDSYRKKYIIVDQPDRTIMEEDFYLRRTAVAPMDYHDARIAVSRFLKVRIQDPRFESI